MNSKSKRKVNSLKTGRPPLSNSSTLGTSGDRASNVNARRKSSRATRKLINTHHQLQKSRAAALAASDHMLVAELDEQITTLGGIQAYQAASLTGQDKERGGDSSEKLVEWLAEHKLVGRDRDLSAKPLRVLEVGALSSKNAISGMIGHGVETVRRVDLHSQEPEQIEEVDFMDLPIPQRTADRFDVLSMSLVLNYVPDPMTRGDMLWRTVSFLRGSELEEMCLPCLFVVLPLPCLSNSRYMDYARFEEMMGMLGYEVLRDHKSQKLHYMLFHHTGPDKQEGVLAKEFKKVEINPGKNRNNFCIILSTDGRS